MYELDSEALRHYSGAEAAWGLRDGGGPNLCQTRRSNAQQVHTPYARSNTHTHTTTPPHRHTTHTPHPHTSRNTHAHTSLIHTTPHTHTHTHTPYAQTNTLPHTHTHTHTHT